jgi:alcohol dehydrogenase (cytochrome c)
MRIERLGLAALCFAALSLGQELTPNALTRPASDTWPTYNGDYSGRRNSPLTQIDRSNVKNLGLQWIYRTSNTGLSGFAGSVKSTPLLVKGTLYFTMPDNVWAVDARTGSEIWHYRYPENPGVHIGSRGVGMYGDWLYFESPDCNLIAIDAKDGKERWRKTIADVKAEYFCTMAPLVVGNKVIVGVGGDSLDNPGFLEARDPETGERQWRWETEPMPGQPGSETWPGAEAMRHGGGMTWMTGTYDPELHLLYWTTGNPNPVHAGDARKGDNLWTCSIVALDPDTGKLQWAFQPSPHDTHDWDAVQTPVLFDGEMNGERRKMLAQASRNGYFFVLDRKTGENLLTAPFMRNNWAKGIDARGQPIPDPKKEPTRDGTLVSPSSNGATNWFPPSFDPAKGLFYVNASQNYSVFYYTAEGKPEGYAGRDDFLAFSSILLAIDYRTGKIRWEHDISGAGAMSFGGLLSTAGSVLFAGDTSGNLLGLDSDNGKTLWHARVGQNTSNGPIAYMADGRQYVLFGAGDSLFCFALPGGAGVGK